MIKKLFALIALLPLTATAAPVIEGVYIGHPSKRLHLESWDYEGTLQYGLTLANLNGDSSYNQYCSYYIQKSIFLQSSSDTIDEKLQSLRMLHGHH